MGKLGGLSVLLVLVMSSSIAQAEDKIPVVDEAIISETWTLPADSKLTVLGYPAEFVNHEEEVCLAVGYLINPDGYTSDLSLLKSWSSREPRRDRQEYWGAFAGVASAAVSQWHFAPKPEVTTPRATYTVSTFVFASPSTLEASKRCAIPNLTERILELKGNTRAKRLMRSNNVFDRLDLDPTMMVRYHGQKRGLQEGDMQRAQNQRALPQPPAAAPPPPPPPPPNPGTGG